MTHRRVYCEPHIIKINKNNEINEVIKCFHISFANNHVGINRTIHNILKFYYFDNMLSKVQKFIKSCKSCKSLKSKSKKKNKALGSSDLRHKIKSVVGLCKTKDLNEKLKQLSLENN